jgi:hypothetical protein
MPGESIGKRKWWHCTLNINDRDSGDTLTTITSANPNNPSINANPDTVLAYSSYFVGCYPVEVPVRSFDASRSPGYFVMMPSVSELSDSIVDVETYQDAINLNNRRIFEFTRTAAYSINCEAQSPISYDTFGYETITNDLASNVFRYPQIPAYTQIGCCELELSMPSTDLPQPGVIGRATRIWYLTSVVNQNTNKTTYSLYSYDFALLSGALVFRGNIDVSIAPNIILYDITWIPIDNTLLAITSDGVRRLYTGSITSDARLGEVADFDRGNLSQNSCIFSSDQSCSFSITSNDLQLYSPKIEYNVYDASLYIFHPLFIINSQGVISSNPSYIRMEYSERTGVKYLSHSIINASFSGDYRIGGLAYPSNYSSSLEAYCILNDSLANIGVSGDIVPVIPTNNLFAGLETLAFVEDPDNTVTGQVLYTSNPAGQLFRVNLEQSTPVNTGYTLSASPVGSTTTINGEDIRVSPFPFVLGRSHWLFLVDISASMSGQRISMIIDAFKGMMQSYVRYNDKITIIGFNDRSPIRISKELKTYSDANEIVSYLETFFIPSGVSTNFCSAISNLHTEFNDLKNVFILSDGTFDDCGQFANFPFTVGASFDQLLSANPGMVVTSVGIMTSTPPPVFQYLSTLFGPYVDWR